MDNLELLYVARKGDLAEERVVIKATAKVDLSNFILVNAYTDDQGYYDLNDKIFWFPSKIVNPGEYVRLFTKTGKATVTEGKFQEQPAKFHDFYWGQKSPVWAAERSNAVLLVQVQKWVGKKI